MKTKVNFIIHFRQWMACQADDDRLTPHHISLYLALFNLWNVNRFHNPLTIRREVLMKIAKIGSRNTYAQCMQDLDAWNYIIYEPAAIRVPGKVYLLTFDTNVLKSDTLAAGENDTLLLKCDTASAQNRAAHGTTFETHLINNKNDINILNAQKHNGDREKVLKMPKPPDHDCTPSSIAEVKDYFVESGAPAIEADKFYNYFQSNGWKVGGRAPMKDWKAAARNWLLNANTLQSHNSVQSPQGSLSKKNYDEPL